MKQLLLLFLLAGCASLTPPPAEPLLLTSRITLLISPSTRTEEAAQTMPRRFSGALEWEHAPHQDILRLLSPFGQTLAEIQRTPENLHITLSNGKTYSGASLDALGQEAIGQALPLAALLDTLNLPNTPHSGTFNAPDGRIVNWKLEPWTKP